MVGVLRRMNKLNELLGLRHGPGAAILPQNVTRIHMEFAAKWNGGHFGPRKFWQNYLPSLKYWNPAVPMMVRRSADQTGPAVMTIYFRQPTTSSTPGGAAPSQPSSAASSPSQAPEPAADESAITIDMKNQRSEAILKDFFGKTGAVPVVPTEQELAAIAEVDQRNKQADVDRGVMQKYADSRQRERDILAQATNDANAIEQG